ncbi:hypothetical protein [Lactobacillus jensenii]|uniref:hypothetical protein n=1 Tax=Lactobacillus jensenii TaxID=109790 RepID=UPI0016484C94|nr:hypothetical protein [Lactobacillus jensenii]MDX5103566.1 hypothetical protein [Lactobacillus jensenii]MDX5115460.1 hypothetical protein [Lactobacillus jensenii]
MSYTSEDVAKGNKDISPKPKHIIDDATPKLDDIMKKLYEENREAMDILKYK